MHRLITPSVQIFVAAIILFTGAGVSAVFWKMPTGAKFYELCHAEVVDKDLAAVPLPSESIASISSEEMKQMSLPTFDITPVVDSGAEKYAQIYEAPASLVALNVEQGKIAPVVAEESTPAPVSPQRFEPMRQIVEDKPITAEPVNKEFLSKPTSVSATEKSDELLPIFHFAENSKADVNDSVKSEQPADPFPVMTAPTPALQPLQPLQFENLSPLLPLQENGLLPFTALTVR